MSMVDPVLEKHVASSYFKFAIFEFYSRNYSLPKKRHGLKILEIWPFSWMIHYHRDGDIPDLKLAWQGG
jgi:hypothetical protein